MQTIIFIIIVSFTIPVYSYMNGIEWTTTNLIFHVVVSVVLVMMKK